MSFHFNDNGSLLIFSSSSSEKSSECSARYEWISHWNKCINTVFTNGHRKGYVKVTYIYISAQCLFFFTLLCGIRIRYSTINSIIENTKSTCSLIIYSPWGLCCPSSTGSGLLEKLGSGEGCRWAPSFSGSAALGVDSSLKTAKQWK